MSKPEPIEYELESWCITYKPSGYDIGVDGPDPVSYEASVKWKANHKDVKPKRVHKNTRRFDEAENWVVLETGVDRL